MSAHFSTLQKRDPSIRETEYLADSQFDFPKSEHGWEYQTLDQQNAFGKWRDRAESSVTATPGAYLVCDDANCIIGRDFVHPGYKLRPAIQWRAKQAGEIAIEGEMSLVRPLARGRLTVRVYVNDMCQLDVVLDYPDIVDFSIRANIARGGIVRIVFGAMEHIDNNHCLYYARVRNISSLTSTTSPVRLIHQQCAPSWEVLEAAISDTINQELDAATLTKLSRTLFSNTKIENSAVQHAAALINRSLFDSSREKFRQPRMFSASTMQPLQAHIDSSQSSHTDGGSGE